MIYIILWIILIIYWLFWYYYFFNNIDLFIQNKNTLEINRYNEKIYKIYKNLKNIKSQDDYEKLYETLNFSYPNDLYLWANFYAYKNNLIVKDYTKSLISLWYCSMWLYDIKQNFRKTLIDSESINEIIDDLIKIINENIILYKNNKELLSCIINIKNNLWNDFNDINSLRLLLEKYEKNFRYQVLEKIKNFENCINEKMFFNEVKESLYWIKKQFELYKTNLTIIKMYFSLKDEEIIRDMCKKFQQININTNMLSYEEDLNSNEKNYNKQNKENIENNKKQDNFNLDESYEYKRNFNSDLGLLDENWYTINSWNYIWNNEKYWKDWFSNNDVKESDNNNRWEDNKKSFEKIEKYISKLEKYFWEKDKFKENNNKNYKDGNPWDENPSAWKIYHYKIEDSEIVNIIDNIKNNSKNWQIKKYQNNYDIQSLINELFQQFYGDTSLFR